MQEFNLIASLLLLCGVLFFFPSYLLLIAGLVFLLVISGLFISGRHTRTLRARGLYPEAGKETDADVLKLLKAGEKIAAIRCHRALHGVGLKEAKEAVGALERNNPKNSD
jgi:hypothetical protein